MIGMEAGWNRLLPYAALSGVIVANVLGNIFLIENGDDDR
jgi:hypothetical protein